MKRDIENINVILEYYDWILATRDLYGDDIEDFMESMQSGGSQSSTSCRSVEGSILPDFISSVE